MNKVLCFLMLSGSCIGQNTQSKIIAHRGAWKKLDLPQNSLASLNQAIKLGCYGSEFDVRMTSDHILIINHDEKYEGLDIEKNSYADLNKIKLKNGESLPQLMNFIKTAKNQTKTKLICEIKPSPSGKTRSLEIAEKTINLIKSQKAEAHFVFISFDFDILLKIKEIYPKAKLQYLNGDKTAVELMSAGIHGADYHLSFFNMHNNFMVKPS